MSPIKGVEIPKRNEKTRLIGIPTVMDRFYQQALHQVLQPIFEPDFLLIRVRLVDDLIILTILSAEYFPPLCPSNNHTLGLYSLKYFLKSSITDEKSNVI